MLRNGNCCCLPLTTTVKSTIPHNSFLCETIPPAASKSASEHSSYYEYISILYIRFENVVEHDVQDVSFMDYFVCLCVCAFSCALRSIYINVGHCILCECNTRRAQMKPHTMTFTIWLTTINIKPIIQRDLSVILCVIRFVCFCV